MGWLEGKAIVVTGAGRGLGRAYAVAAAREGAQVLINDIDGASAQETAELVDQAGGRAAVSTDSIAEWEGARALVDGCVDAFGALDGFVNNAAVLPGAILGTEETEPTVRSVVDVNVFGMLACGIHALRAMTRQGHGSLVNVTSGAHLGMPLLGTYGASKGAVASITYAWDLEGRAHGVRVNAISPVAQTPMWQIWGDKDTLVKPEPEDIAPLVIFLLSDRSADVMGQIVRIDLEGVSLLQRPRFHPPVALTERSPQAVADSFAGELAELLEAEGETALRQLAWAPQSE
jgi:NAD(P)-dependent dehydrogenase (short-subunit alcohol dehydrogenase family)